MTIPKHIMDEARAVWATLPKEAAGIHAIAEALHRIDLAAEQRGREMERAACLQIAYEATLECDWMDGVIEAGKIASAIRSRTTEG